MTHNFKSQTLVILTIAIAILLFVLWSLWAQLDQVTRAPAKLIPYDRLQIVQSEQDGAILNINVKEGQLVEKGEVLVELDTVQLRAALREAGIKVAALKSRMARIEAELFLRPMVFASSLREFPEFMENQRSLYDRRQAAFNSELETLENLASLREQELDLNLPLLESGDVALSEIIRLRRAIVEIRGEISRTKANNIRELQEDLTNTEEELSAALEQEKRAADLLDAAYLRSPMIGIVKNLRFTTIGGVVRPGDEVLQIVPYSEQLVAEVKVSPSEIAFVEVGQEARINFDTYDNSIYGSALGVVTLVGPDTVTEQAIDGSVEIYYRVNLEVDISPMKSRLGEGPVALQPGMTGTAEILTGRSTVWEYLTKPLLKTFSRSMEER